MPQLTYLMCTGGIPAGIDPLLLTSAAFELVQASQALQAVQAVPPLLHGESPPIMTPLTQVRSLDKIREIFDFSSFELLNVGGAKVTSVDIVSTFLVLFVTCTLQRDTPTEFLSSSTVNLLVDFCTKSTVDD
jgi:hypothetical protein